MGFHYLHASALKHLVKLHIDVCVTCVCVCEGVWYSTYLANCLIVMMLQRVTVCLRHLNPVMFWSQHTGVQQCGECVWDVAPASVLSNSRDEIPLRLCSPSEDETFQHLYHHCTALWHSSQHWHDQSLTLTNDALLLNISTNNDLRYIKYFIVFVAFLFSQGE